MWRNSPSSAGQKAVITKAKRSIAGFKLREGMPIGVTVTLRRGRMFDFLDKLFNVALPRVKDFRGVPEKIFDGRGNCTLGVKEQIIFPEIDYDKIEKLRGLNISIVTTAKTDQEGHFLLKEMGCLSEDKEKWIWRRNRLLQSRRGSRSFPPAVTPDAPFAAGRGPSFENSVFAGFASETWPPGARSRVW